MASKLFAVWAAKEMKLDEEATKLYSKALIELSINSKDNLPIIEYVERDFIKLGINISKHVLEEMFLERLEQCMEQLNNR